MPDHYYTSEPSSAHRPNAVAVNVLGQALRFDTDAGVFSRDGLDFGSRLLIESLPELTGRVLDMGAGWGAIGVALAAANPEAEFVLCDINRRAVELSRGNIQANGLKNARAIESDGFDAVEGLFDAIVTNPPIRAGKQLIYRLFDGARDRLKPGGSLYIVIRKQQGAPSALKHLEEVYGQASVIERDKGFWIIEARKG